MAQITAYAPHSIKTHQRITKVVDGDGLFVVDMFGKRETEIRLLGIDAPEIKRCQKLLQDERELHLPGQLLMELGRAAKQHLASLVPIGTNVTVITEQANCFDLYGRTLAYVLLPNGTCLNEKLVSDGFVKPYCKHFCKLLPAYQQLNAEAMQDKRGLYSAINRF